MSSVVLSLVLLVPLTPHTPAEQRVWEKTWEEKVKANGILSEELLVQYVDFQIAHAPKVSSTSTTTSTATSTTSSTYSGIGDGVEQWRGLVSRYFSEVDRALCIMNAESGGNPNAKNPASSARGLFQILASLWAPHYGVSYEALYDPELNVRLAADIHAQYGWWAWSPYKRGMCR